MKKISIIIPFYNTGENIKKCIYSIMNQKKININDLEIILINDCSDKETTKIVENLLENNKNFIYIVNEKNIGVSASRNIGKSHATGEFITFIDSDDWISDQYLWNNYTFLKKHMNEIDFTTNKIMMETKNIFTPHGLNIHLKKKIVDLDIEQHAIVAAVNKTFFVTERIKDIWFETKISIAEDSIFVAKCIYKRKFGVTPNATYFYSRNNENSLIKSSLKDKKKYLEVYFLYDVLKKIKQMIWKK